MIEVFAVLALGGVVALLIHRFPDTRNSVGKDVDDALHNGSVRASWFLVAFCGPALVVAWLLL